MAYDICYMPTIYIYLVYANDTCMCEIGVKRHIYVKTQLKKKF